MQIRLDDLTGPEVTALIQTHLAEARETTPPESIHALDLDALRVSEITFWTAWDGATLLGCGALKELDSTHGEIKSMHTALAHRRRGVAAALLTWILAEAQRRSYRRISLETGANDAFATARALYLRFGFKDTGPFGDYDPDPNSAFMTLELQRLR